MIHVSEIRRLSSILYLTEQSINFIELVQNLVYQILLL